MKSSLRADKVLRPPKLSNLLGYTRVGIDLGLRFYHVRKGLLI